MSIAVFLSRILGLIRDQVMAGFFGTSYVNDAFNVAFRIPNLLRGLFGEGALSAAFVPIYNEFGVKRGRKFQYLFAINVLSILSFFLLILTFLGVIFSPLIVKIFYPGLSVETSLLAINLSRIMFPYLFFIGLSSTFIAILNSHNIFFVTGLSSGLWNIGWILMLVFGSVVLIRGTNDLIYYAAYGVVIGGFFQTIINLPFLKRLGYHFGIILRFKTVAMKSLWSRFLPGVFGMGVREINLLAEGFIASFLATGSITALGFGYRLMQMPLGMFGVSIGTAVLPEFSRQFTEKRWDDLSETLRYSICFIILVLLPISVAMIMGSEPIIRVLFQRGQFGDEAVYMTQLALNFYLVGLCFFGLNHVITPVFFAGKDTKTPIKIAAYTLVVNVVLSVILMQSMQLAGIAFSSSLCAVLQFWVKIVILKKRFPEIQIKSFWNILFKMSVILSVLIIILSVYNKYFFTGVGFLNNLYKIIWLAIISILYLFLTYNACNLDYFKDIQNKLIKRIIK